MEIAYNRYSLMIEGRPTFIRSGAMHYFRLPSQCLWRDRLFKLKAAGYNAVDLYFCWNYHSPAPGVYDFTGIRDVRELLRITQELGLWVIARPGPYINAEYSGGGFPGWLLAKTDLPLRNRRDGAFEWSDEYMGYVREWWEQIIPILNEAPNIILMQIENEYATLDVEPDYMRALYEMTRSMGVKVPLFHNDLYVAGLYEDIVDIYAFDNYSVTQFETDWRDMPEVFQVLDHVESNLRPFCAERPLMAAELQAGWFGTWKGYKYEKITELLGREHIGISTKSLLGQGLTIFNHYKAIGGTNWDYTGSIETYTSYDFGAPISEAGVNTERLFEAKAINLFLSSFDWTATDRRERFALPLSHTDCYYVTRSPQAHPEAEWLFLRNLSYEAQTTTVGELYPVTIRPFEVLILPYRMPLASGLTLEFSTSEVLYQTEPLLVLKANRPVMACLSTTASATPPFVVDGHAAEVVLQDSGEGLLRFYCAELPPDTFRQVRLGDLTILLLGQNLIDTFWVEPSGEMVMGPQARLVDGTYGLLDGLREGMEACYRIRTQGQSVRVAPLANESESKWAVGAARTQIPALGQWSIHHEAPEILPGWPAQYGSLFSPVQNGRADFDANGLYEGSAWYRLPLQGQPPQHIEVDARHIWAVFLNGMLVGQGQQLVVIYGMAHPAPTVLSIPPAAWNPDGPNDLLIFVDGLGHPKGFHDDGQTPEGLLSLRVDGEDCTGRLQILPGLYSRRQSGDVLLGEQDASDGCFEKSPLVRLKTTFQLPVWPDTAVSWGLKLQNVDFGRINIYLNRMLVGRYWRECRRQEVFYLPAGVLNTEAGADNTLELILMNFEPFIDRNQLSVYAQQVALHPFEILTCVRG